MKVVNVVAAIIKKDNKILITQRGYGEFKGMYEFPGGKVEQGESNEQALVREIKEELNANIEVDYYFTHSHYEYSSFILEMDCYVCHLLDDHLELLEHEDYKWIEPDEQDICWIAGDISVIEDIRNRGI